MIKSILFLITLLFGQIGFTQQLKKDKGNINLHLGAILYYTTYSIGYESLDFLHHEKHSLRANLAAGTWTTSFLGKNIGFQTNIGLNYSLGKKHHLLDIGSALVFHFDKSLKNEGLSYIATTYRPFIGYRYQPLEKRIILKIGFGWKELLQLGFGIRI